MNYGRIIAPYLSNISIDEKVETFREYYCGDSIPIEIEDIIELKLKIGITPIPGFLKMTNMDALITSDWEEIYVDKNEYLDDRRYNRLRFSLAHEVGHLIMHKQVYNNFEIKTLEDYYKLYKNIPERQYGYLECQANKFASYLLIPRKILAIEAEKELKNKDDPRLQKIERTILNSYLARPLSKIFRVSEEAVEIALNDLIP